MMVIAATSTLTTSVTNRKMVSSRKALTQAISVEGTTPAR